MRKLQHIIIGFLYLGCVLPAMAGDTLSYTLQQCRDLALTSGVASQSQEEMRLAAKYNREAALAAMFAFAKTAIS